MKKKWNYVAAAISLLAIVMCFVIGCDNRDNSQKIELSERISKVRQNDGTYNLVNTETGKTLIKDISVDWVQTGNDFGCFLERR